MKLLANINNIAGDMSTMDRYSQTRLINPESVLEHTGWVCLCSMLICAELKENGEEIDMALVLAKATIHDIEEVVTGDIANPTKYFDKEITHQLLRVSASAAKQVLDVFNSSQYLRNIWTSSKSGTEGYIVALADKLAVVYKTEQEVNGFGNAKMKDHIKGLIPALEYLIGELEYTGIHNQSIILNIIQEAIEICKNLK